MVRHARDHVRRFWAAQNRRTIGLLMVMFATIYAIGFVFTTLLSQNFMGNVPNVFFMWGILFAIGLALIMASISLKHYSTTRMMSAKEHAIHSRNIGIFLLGIGIGAVLFTLPVTLVPGFASLMILFSLGGILLLMYTFLDAIFGQKYYEIGFASLVMWIVFVLGAFAFSNIAYANPPEFQSLSLMVASISIIVVFAITGALMLYRAGSEFHGDFRKANRIR
ncbi:MAG: hypothetical protein KGH65_00380 [Candidatus Micrarchaeota archaeon]|nr:hypothetical protein [Candidatus Micrarchaeota archaeon]